MSTSSMTTDPVDPGDVRTMPPLDYSALLADLGDNIVIVGSEWDVPDGLTVVDDDFDDTTTRIKIDFANAVIGRNYTLYNRVTITGGDVRRRSMIIPVRDASTFSPASNVKETLDAIRAALAKSATRGQLERDIGGTRIQFMTPEQLIVAETKFQQLYNQERRAERLRNGEPFFKNVLTRFVSNG